MVFVDALFTLPARRDRQAYRVGTRTGHRWCHMYCDGDLEELHEMARKIGMRREWFQPHRRLPHYDLTPGNRGRALALGAQERSSREHIAALRRNEGHLGG